MNGIQAAWVASMGCPGAVHSRHRASIRLSYSDDVENSIPYSMSFRTDEELPHKREIAPITPKCSHNC